MRELFRKFVVFPRCKKIKGPCSPAENIRFFPSLKHIEYLKLIIPKSYLSYNLFFFLNFAFISVIVSSSSEKNSTLLSGWTTYDTRNNNNEIFWILVIYISFIKVFHLVYNKITYSVGSINRNTERTEVTEVWNWVPC